MTFKSKTRFVAFAMVGGVWAVGVMAQAVPAAPNSDKPYPPLSTGPGYFRPYAHLGISDAGYSNALFSTRLGRTDNGLALKGGIDFARGLAGVPQLGLTGYYAYSRASEDGYFWSAGCILDRKVSSHTLAFGPTGTFDLPTPNVPIAIQGRVVLAYNKYKVSRDCSQDNDSGNDIDVGLGVGAQYKLNDRFTLRVDLDDVGWKATQLTVGTYFDF